MFGLTNLGVVHTLISLVAVAAGIVSFVRYGSISLRTSAGLVYVVTTVLTVPHGVRHLQDGCVRAGARRSECLRSSCSRSRCWSRRVPLQAPSRGRSKPSSYTTTFFLHMIPAINETTTRLPPSAPLAAGPNDPLVLVLVGTAFVLFIAGAVVQVVRLKAVAPASAR